MSKFFVVNQFSEKSNSILPDSERDAPICRKAAEESERLNDHVVEIYNAYFQLRDKLEGLKNFDLTTREAVHEISALINNFEDLKLVEMLRGMIKEKRGTAASNKTNDEIKASTGDEDDYKKEPSIFLQNPSKEIEKVTDATIRSEDSSIDRKELNLKVMESNMLSEHGEQLGRFPEHPIMDFDPVKSYKPILQTSISAVNDEIPSDYNGSDRFTFTTPADHPMISEKEIKFVEKIWDLGKSGIKWKKGYKFSPDVYYSLKPGELVCDDIVNGYSDLIVERSGKHGLPSVSAMPAYFLPLCKKWGWENMKNCEVNVKADLVLFPMHIPGHWYCCIVDMRDHDMYGPEYRTIKILDSTRHENSRYEEPISFVKKFLGYKIEQQVKWRSIIVKDAPQQNNGIDCGIFLCKCNDYLSTDGDPTFSANDILYHRYRMVLELEAGCLSRALCGVPIGRV